MEKYFAIFEKEEKKAPSILTEGILHSELNEKDPFKPLSSDGGVWREMTNKKADLPEKLWFITRDREYLFDLRYDSGGFFVSREMLELFQEFKVPNFVYTKLIILNKKLEPVSTKEYFYLKFYDYNDVIDYPNSKIDFDKKGYPKKIWKLAVDMSSITTDVFLIDTVSLFNKLFCNDKFKKACIDRALYGIQFIDSEEAGVFKV